MVWSAGKRYGRVVGGGGGGGVAMDGGNGGGRGNGGGGGGGEPKDQAVGSVTDESPDSLTPRHVRSSTQPAPKPHPQ